MLFVMLANTSLAAAPTGRFIVSADTVRDAQTGLVWQRSEAGVGMTYADAVAYCAGLGLDGQAGWRLPRYKELLTLVDPREALLIDPTAFPGTNNSPYWTSTACVTTASCPSSQGVEYQYVVRFTRLGVMATPRRDSPASGNITVRCVR